MASCIDGRLTLRIWHCDLVGEMVLLLIEGVKMLTAKQFMHHEETLWVAKVPMECSALEVTT